MIDFTSCVDPVESIIWRYQFRHELRQPLAQYRTRDHLGEPGLAGCSQRPRVGVLAEPEHRNPREAGDHVGRIGAVDVGDHQVGRKAARLRDHLMPAGAQHGVDLAPEEQIHSCQLDDAHSDSVMWLTQPFSTKVRSKNTSSPAASSTSPLNMRTMSYRSRISRNSDIVWPSATAASRNGTASTAAYASSSPAAS